MSTGAVESWKGVIAEIGPVYPFVGSEVIMVIVAVAFWLIWHFMQSAQEKQEIEEAVARFRKDEHLKEQVHKAHHHPHPPA